MLVVVRNLNIFDGNILTAGIAAAFIDGSKGTFPNLLADRVSLSELLASRQIILFGLRSPESLLTASWQGGFDFQFWFHSL